MQSHIHMTTGLLIQYMEKIFHAFPDILGSPSSYVTLHPIPSEFPYTYMREILFSFLSVQCKRIVA